ncbi:MAG: hypothetical protein JXA93_08375 [Anaerolineae bacterium]|nr:hypothetical protein [Anaerolineae bacterium]
MTLRHRRSGAGPDRPGPGWLVAAALLVLTCSCASPVAARLGVATGSASGPAAPGTASGADEPRVPPPGAGRRIEFRRLTVEDGLSQSTANCIVQDTRGFMWFGTQDGLNRYDGYTFRVYEQNPDDPHSLSSNWIEQCYRDRLGALWFITDDDLDAAVHEAFAGRSTLAPEAIQALIHIDPAPALSDIDAVAAFVLTPREQEVLAPLIEGLTNPEIADRLVVSRSTAKAHVSNILSKMGASNRAEAISLARQYDSTKGV